ncbi:MAG: CdaR family protein [Polaribacter sp.]
MAANKISNQFLLFLGVSALIWLLITLSKEYTTSLDLYVKFTNVPQNKMLENNNLQQIKVDVKASGFKIIRTRIQNSSIDLDASLVQQNKQQKHYLLLEKQIQLIQNQLYSDVVVQRVVEDTLFVNLDVLESKRVAVTPNMSVNYHVGYGLIDKIKIQPDSILISGSKSVLDTISHLPLASVKLNDVKENFEEKVKVVLNNLDGLKLATDEIVISGSVDKFTEGSLKIPFEITNVPTDVKLTTLTENITITFVVGLSDFNKVVPSLFKIECDYGYSVDQNLTYLIPKLVKKPKFIKSYKISPHTIDFLIQK